MCGSPSAVLIRYRTFSYSIAPVFCGGPPHIGPKSNRLSVLLFAIFPPTRWRDVCSLQIQSELFDQGDRRFEVGIKLFADSR